MKKIKPYVEIASPGYLKDYPDGDGGFLIPVIFRESYKSNGLFIEEQLIIGMNHRQISNLVAAIKNGSS